MKGTSTYHTRSRSRYSKDSDGWPRQRPTELLEDIEQAIRSLQKSKAGPFIDNCLCAGPFFYQTATGNNENDASAKQKVRVLKIMLAASHEKLLH